MSQPRKITSELGQTLAQALQHRHPEISAALALRYATKYVDAVLAELHAASQRPANWCDEEISINASAIYRDAGRTSSGRRIYSLMQESPDTSILLLEQRGNQGQYNRMILNPQYKDLAMREYHRTVTQDSTGLDNISPDDLWDQATDVVEIDRHSLLSFCQRTEQELQSGAHAQAYRSAAETNLRTARQLLGRIRELDGSAYIPEVRQRADTGRVYGLGQSLIRTRRAVRHAALGACWQYDFNAHSFAVLASWALKIRPDSEVRAIQEYVRNRNQIRQRIARNTGRAEWEIKSVFTSLGFGARPQANWRSSIARIMGGAYGVEQLLRDQTFRTIYRELLLVRRTVANFFASLPAGWELFQGCQYPAGRRNTNQMLAWIYQNTEAYLTQQFVDYVAEHTQQQPRLTVHDAVYYSQRIPAEVLRDAKLLLSEQFALVRISAEQIIPISTDSYRQQLYQEQQALEQRHRLHIEQEEQQARVYQARCAEIIADQHRIRPVPAQSAADWDTWDPESDPEFASWSIQEQQQYLQIRQGVLRCH